MLYESLNCVPAVAHLNDLLRQQSENAFWTSKNRWVLLFCAVFLVFLFSYFWLVLKGSDSQNRLRGLISCPGQLPNQSRREFHIYSDFSLHVVSMCRPCAKLFSGALPPQNLKPRSIDSIFNIVLISHIHYVFEFSNFKHNSDYQPNWTPAVNRQPGFRREDS